MLQKFKNWLRKNEEDFEVEVEIPKNETAKFILLVDHIRMGELYCANSAWSFKYTDEFKKHSGEYNRIVGFPDLDTIYNNETLWPFFQVRIPGLKQPAIKEIIQKEKIDITNEVELLKRFGKKTITNPYELVTG